MTDTNTAQMVADLTATNDAVQGKGWVAPGLSGAGGPLGLLGSTADPLSGLASAGLAWFTPFVSFLSDGLSQLQGGDAASVSSGSQDFGNAGQDIGDLAGSYQDSTTAQTSSWSGPAASDYRDAAAQHATGVAGLGAASTTVGSSIIGAGQVVAQAIADITELIGEAVAQIVPIMTQAVARAQQTMGESVVEAIPPCVGIAVEYALRIAAKLAALMASGQNLLKLVQGASGVVDLIQQAMSSISQQSIQGGTQPSATTQPAANTPDAATTGPTAPASMPDTSDSGGSDAGASMPDVSSDSGDSPDLSNTPDMSASSFAGSPADVTDPPDLGSDTQSAAAVPPIQSTVPSGYSAPVHTDSGQAPSGGALPTGAGIGLAAGARSAAGRGSDTVRQGRKLASASSPAGERANPGAVPLGGRTAGEKDKEHKRKYTIIEEHDETIDVTPAVIIGSTPED